MSRTRPDPNFFSFCLPRNRESCCATQICNAKPFRVHKFSRTAENISPTHATDIRHTELHTELHFFIREESAEYTQKASFL